MLPVHAFLAAALCARRLAAQGDVGLMGAFTIDDQCLEAESDSLAKCALSALQHRGQLRATPGTEPEDTEGYADADHGTAVGEQANVSEEPSAAAGEAASEAAGYGKNWEASGDTFFDKFVFMKVGEMHGANQLVDKESAFREGLVSSGDGHAIIRVGKPGEPHKRKTVNIHTKAAWLPSRSFVAVLKYNHLPFGPAVWPGFWSMNSDRVWPAGGELDILEYANGEPNKVSFHTDKDCFLDASKASGSLACKTDYFQNKFGCTPTQRQQSGSFYSGLPGVIAMEWTLEHIKVFHIPEAEIPDDIANERPQPESWDRWTLAYLPFDVNSCSADVAGQQELVLNIGLCGDWAGGTFQDNSGSCKVDIWDPPNDCCTKYATSSAADGALQANAYFDISWLKVFTKEGTSTPVGTSGSFRRNGIPLQPA